MILDNQLDRENSLGVKTQLRLKENTLRSFPNFSV